MIHIESERVMSVLRYIIDCIVHVHLLGSITFSLWQRSQTWLEKNKEKKRLQTLEPNIKGPLVE